MAKSEAKKRLEANNQRILLLRRITFGVNAVYVLYRLLYHWSSFGFLNWVGLALLTAGYWLSHRGIEDFAKPFQDDEGKLDLVPDIDKPQGLAEYCFDVLYIQWFVQVTSMFWGWFWLVYLIIPSYAIYKIGFLIGPTLFSMLKAATGGSGAASGARGSGGRKQEEDETDPQKLAKKQRKLERKQQRVVYVRR